MESQSEKLPCVPRVTEFTPEQDIEFARMDRELDDYNMALGRGENPPPPPKYPREKFLIFRDWQAKRLKEMFK